jgi:hypothetical protein
MSSGQWCGKRAVLCSFDLALQFARIFIVIHEAIHPSNARKIAQSSSKPPIIWRSA